MRALRPRRMRRGLTVVLDGEGEPSTVVSPNITRLAYPTEVLDG